MSSKARSAFGDQSTVPPLQAIADVSEPDAPDRRGQIAPVPHVAALQEYEVTSQDVWTRSDLEQTLKLDWNESTQVSQTAKRALRHFLDKPGALNWYPDVGATVVTKKLSERLGLSPLEILVFGGSDVALETVARAYAMTGDEVGIVVPGYDNFRVYAQSTGAAIWELRGSEDGASMDDGYLVDAIVHHGSPRILYMINPNNPIGYLTETEALERILRAFPSTLVIIDEAYIEFAGETCSAVSLVRRYENLIVSRSFSKAYGLAGLRLGYLASSPANLRHLRKLRNGKNVSMLAQVAAAAVLDAPAESERHVRRVCEAREWFLTALRNEGAIAYTSFANFILLATPKPPELVLELYRRGIHVRNRSRLAGSIAPSVRITIGYRTEMQRVLDALRDIPRELWIKTADAG